MPLVWCCRSNRHFRELKDAIFSEVSFPPFSYILAIDSDSPDTRMLDITFFSSFGYNEFVTLNLPLQVVEVYAPLRETSF